MWYARQEQQKKRNEGREREWWRRRANCVVISMTKNDVLSCIAYNVHCVCTHLPRLRSALPQSRAWPARSPRTTTSPSRLRRCPRRAQKAARSCRRRPRWPPRARRAAHVGSPSRRQCTRRRATLPLPATLIFVPDHSWSKRISRFSAKLMQIIFSCSIMYATGYSIKIDTRRTQTN